MRKQSRVSQEVIVQHVSIMVIGQQDAGKSMLIKKFTQSPGLTKIISVNGEHFEFEVMDTPSYDSFFTMLPMSSKSITGYVLVFSRHNTEILNTLREIREKLFQINGFHKPMVIIGNIIEQPVNETYAFEQDLVEVQQWCVDQQIRLFQEDLNSSTDIDINLMFQALVYNPETVSKLLQLLMAVFLFGALLVIGFGMWYIIKNPALHLMDAKVDTYFLLALCVGVNKMLICGFIYLGITEKNKVYIQRSTLLVATDAVLSTLQLILAILIGDLGCILVSTVSIIQAAAQIYLRIKL